MDKKTIDNIVWWIPFKKLRNSVRELLLYNIETRNLLIKNQEIQQNIINKLSHIEHRVAISSNYSALICDKLEINDFDLSIPPMPAEYKRMTIIKYAKNYNCKTLIETGTYYGDTTFFCKDYFEQIYTIELLDILFEKALIRFKDYKNINVIKGDSSIELPNLLNKINNKTIFWLDGHYCGDNFTAKGVKETPIFEEIKSILDHKIKNHVILIDDARCFGVWPDYPTIEEII